MLFIVPAGLPDFRGHDPQIHIATLSLWRDIESARRFVYRGLHREALTRRYDWFVKGPWPGHVLWTVEDGTVPRWADGVRRLETLARDGESAEGFTFSSPWGRSGPPSVPPSGPPSGPPSSARASSVPPGR